MCPSELWLIFLFLVKTFKQYCGYFNTHIQNGSESIPLVTQLCGAADGQYFIVRESLFPLKQAEKLKSVILNLTVGGLFLASTTWINVQVFVICSDFVSPDIWRMKYEICPKHLNL